MVRIFATLKVQDNNGKNISKLYLIDNREHVGYTFESTYNNYWDESKLIE